ncbi:hypothetical protein B0H67DRAFT_591597 [Lasiosphaeris hirsuta]|uniref:Uncharacterized protein n=1 Tax=Lasiosphaeris hirsuta TaxID=260670 RepID=A0AA39ZVY1_9PEZI|nr:hypothetical protein B0H67DRAFT_591597 [Lasiosphaeris hirsuta]
MSFRDQVIQPSLLDHLITDQTIMITGANKGLSLEAAYHFVWLEAAKVILGCRSIVDGEAAATDIPSSSGRHNLNVCEAWELNLTNFSSLQRFLALICNYFIHSS